MATFLHVRGMDPMVLHESFNKTRGKVNAARKMREDYRLGSRDKWMKNEQVSFKIELPDPNDDDNYIVGRAFFNIDDIICVLSDQEKDVVGEYTETDDDED